MQNYRNAILRIAEDLLHEFVRSRIKEMDIENTWKTSLVEFIEKEYPEHPANYEKIHLYLQDNDIDKLTIEELDITALSALIFYYFTYTRFPSNMWDISNKKYVYSRTKQYLSDIRELRNFFEHYTQEVVEKEMDAFVIDQLYYLGCLSNFALFLMKHRPDNDYWKRKYNEIKRIEHKLEEESILSVNSVKGFDEDITELMHLANQDNSIAQLKVGMAYYYGTNGAEENKEKAFEWISKAADREEPEAEYMMSLFFIGKRYNAPRNERLDWLFRSAKHGFAEAQYEYGNCQCINVHNSKELEEFLINNKLTGEFYKIIPPNLLDSYNKQYWMEKAANQNHPEAVYELSSVYNLWSTFLINTDQTESERLKRISKKYEEKAIELKSPSAIFYRGVDIAKTDPDTGIKLIEYAVQLGYSEKHAKHEIESIKNETKNL